MGALPAEEPATAAGTSSGSTSSAAVGACLLSGLARIAGLRLAVRAREEIAPVRTPRLEHSPKQCLGLLACPGARTKAVGKAPVRPDEGAAALPLALRAGPEDSSVVGAGLSNTLELSGDAAPTARGGEAEATLMQGGRSSCAPCFCCCPPGSCTCCGGCCLWRAAHTARWHCVHLQRPRR